MLISLIFSTPQRMEQRTDCAGASTSKLVCIHSQWKRQQAAKQDVNIYDVTEGNRQTTFENSKKKKQNLQQTLREHECELLLWMPRTVCRTQDTIYNSTVLCHSLETMLFWANLAAVCGFGVAEGWPAQPPDVAEFSSFFIMHTIRICIIFLFIYLYLYWDRLAIPEWS